MPFVRPAAQPRVLLLWRLSLLLLLLQPLHGAGSGGAAAQAAAAAEGAGPCAADAVADAIAGVPAIGGAGGRKVGAGSGAAVAR